MKGAQLILSAGLLGAGLALVACSESGPEIPVEGTAVVSLTSNATDGAILLRVTGPGFETPQAAGSGSVLHWRQVSESEIVVAVFGAIGNGALFRVAIPDVRKVGQYVGSVLQVADRNDDLRSELSGYRLDVRVAVDPE
jgi:hypothetical protein